MTLFLRQLGKAVAETRDWPDWAKREAGLTLHLPNEAALAKLRAGKPVAARKPRTPKPQVLCETGASRTGDRYTLLLPYPVSTNHLFATVRGRRVKTEAATAYATESARIARTVFKRPIPGRVCVQIIYAPKSGVGLDIDNVVKATLDGLTGAAWEDDRQVCRLVVERVEARPGGWMEVRIGPMEEAEV